MFLIGASSSLIVYLLVPAFLIICLYFKGIAGGTEGVVPPPAYCYAYQEQTQEESICLFAAEKEKQEAAEVVFPAEENALPAYGTSLPPSPALRENTGRAPPLL